MDVKKRVIETILNNLPSTSGGSGGESSSLEFFLDPSQFPIGDDLGADRNSWEFGFSWLDGLGETQEPIEVIHFEASFKKSEFRGLFKFSDKEIQILGDFDPPRGLNRKEIEFLTSEMPDVCQLFLVGVYRPSIVRETKSRLPAIGLDAVVSYWTTRSSTNRRVANPLERLAVSTRPVPVHEPVQEGSSKGASFIEGLLK